MGDIHLRYCAQTLCALQGSAQLSPLIRDYLPRAAILHLKKHFDKKCCHMHVLIIYSHNKDRRCAFRQDKYALSEPKPIVMIEIYDSGSSTTRKHSK